MKFKKIKSFIPYIFIILSAVLFSIKIDLDTTVEPNYAVLEDSSDKEDVNSEVDFDEIEDTEVLKEKSDYKEYIESDGDINDLTIDYLNEKLNMIPKPLLDKYFNNGGKILITDKNIATTYYDKYNFGNVIGIHDATKNVIYISNSEYAIDNALIHEFGHVLDNMSGWKSMDEYFYQIFEKEKDTFDVYSVDNHYKKNEREFFAEVFQQYILDPESCKSSAPMSYDFVEVMIKSS